MPQTECGFSDDPSGTKGCDLLVAHGPTLIVDVGLDAAFDLQTFEAPAPRLRGIWALVDTGATESHIDEQLATALNLPIVDRQQYGGADGLRMANMYLAQIHIPSLDYTIYGEFAGVEMTGQRHKALIGRTFLKNFTMMYVGPSGSVTLHK